MPQRPGIHVLLAQIILLTFHFTALCLSCKLDSLFRGQQYRNKFNHMFEVPRLKNLDLGRSSEINSKVRSKTYRITRTNTYKNISYTKRQYSKGTQLVVPSFDLCKPESFGVESVINHLTRKRRRSDLGTVLGDFEPVIRKRLTPGSRIRRKAPKKSTLKPKSSPPQTTENDVKLMAIQKGTTTKSEFEIAVEQYTLRSQYSPPQTSEHDLMALQRGKKLSNESDISEEHYDFTMGPPTSPPKNTQTKRNSTQKPKKRKLKEGRKKEKKFRQL